MLKKTITFTDYDGNERTEDFYFNLNQTELFRMEASTTGGMEKMLEKIVSTQDTQKIVELFEKIILMAYGEKSADGKRFIKSPELSEAFKQTEAYDQLFMEMLTDGDAALNFINGILPKNLAAEVQKQNLSVLEGKTGN